MTEKFIEDRGQYTKAYKESDWTGVPERTKQEVFDQEKGGYNMQPKDIQKFYNSRYFLFSKFDRGI